MLDISTLTLAVAVIYFFQSMLFYFVAKHILEYQGMQYLAFAALLLSASFVFIYLRSKGIENATTILLSNTLQLCSIFLFHMGTKRIISTSFNYVFNLGMLFLCISILTYFTLVENSMIVRVICYSSAIAFWSVRIALTITTHSSVKIKAASKFLSILFILVAIFFLARILWVLIHPFDHYSLFINNTFNAITLVFGASIGFFWMLGIIVFKNQILTTELIDKTAELEQSNAQKAKVLSVLSHDLRGPINTLASFTNLLKDEASDIDNSKRALILNSMQQTAYYSSVLVDNILDWSQMKNNKNTSFQTLSYQELMPEVMGLIASTAQSKQIDILDNILPETAFIVDRRMAQSIFRNLLNNAIKFTPNGGKIKLDMVLNSEGKRVFTVQDSGIGMNAEIQENLFKSSSKSRRPGTGGEPSTGLGLQLCKDFVELHGGAIWATSEPNKGSTFHFTLEV